MTDLNYIKDLIAILKINGVNSIEMQGLKLSFHVEQGYQPPIASGPDSTQIIADTLKAQEASMPADLRADTLLDQEKVLNWSSPDNHQEGPEIPAIDEQPL